MNSGLPNFRTQLIGTGTLSNHHRSSMPNVTIQVFPMHADIARLRQFIDSSLNFVDDGEAPPLYFKPLMPYVLLQILDYPYLAVTTRNSTVFVQDEVSVTIPLECYMNDNGSWRFLQFASFTPFLYLDMVPSMISGRDIFGLPKVVVSFQGLENAFRPNYPAPLVNLSIRHSGPKGDEFLPFIQVVREPQHFRSTSILRDAVELLPRAVMGWYSVAAARVQDILRAPITGYDGVRDLSSIGAILLSTINQMIAGAGSYPLMQPVPDNYASTADIQLAPLFFDNVTLKQFRDAEQTENVCYQSLVRSAMYLDRFNAGGLLYDPQSGDPTSGIVIRLYDTPNQTIAQSLGIDVAETIMGEERQTHTVKAHFPFWVNVDLSYALGTNLYWRGRDTRWSFSDDPGGQSDSPNPYLTFGGGASAEVAQPFVSPETDIWLIPLPLDQHRGILHLTDLCQKYLENDYFRFKPFRSFSRFVWMLVYGIDNTSEGGGVYKSQEVEFAWPVAWYPKTEPAPCFLGILPLYVFSDGETQTITGSEVFGRPVVLSSIDRSSVDWTSSELGPMLNVTTSVIPALYSGAAPEDRRIIEVFAAARIDPSPPKPAFYPPPGEIAPMPEEENGPQKKTSPGALQSGGIVLPGLPGLRDIFTQLVMFIKILSSMIASGTRIRLPFLTLKQVVDCRLPQRASYQAVVLRDFRFRSLVPLGDGGRGGIRPIIKIHRYSSLPMAETMALHISASEAGDYTTVDIIQAPTAFHVKASMVAEDAVNMCWRAGNSPWQAGDIDTLRRKADLRWGRRG